MSGKLTKAEREKLEREAHQLEEDSNELARKAQRLRRQLLSDDDAGRALLSQEKAND